MTHKSRGKKTSQARVIEAEEKEFKRGMLGPVKLPEAPLEKLDTLVKLVVNEIPKNEEMQKKLFNPESEERYWKGKPFRVLDKKAKEFKWTNIASTNWNREKAMAQIELIEMMLEEGKKREHPLIKALEAKPELKQDLEELKEQLNLAVHQFNKQLILRTRQNQILEDFDVMRAVPQSKIREINEAINQLEGRYYIEGKSLMMRAGRVWDKLAKDEVGKMFLLDIEGIHLAAADRMGRLEKEKMDKFLEKEDKRLRKKK